jgi:O-antigen/teichoic acid export membrane protein
MSAEAVDRSDAAILARGAIVNLLGSVGRISRALSMFLIARFFGVEILGLYAMAWIFIEFVGRFVTFGQDPVVVYFMSRARSDGDEDAGARVVASSLIIVSVAAIGAMLAILATTQIIAELLLNDPEVVLALRPMALALPAVGMMVVLLAATRSRKVMKYHVLARSFIEPFALLIGTVIAWSLDAGLVGLAIAPAAAMWIALIASVFFYRALFPLKPVFAAFLRPGRIGDMLRYSLPTVGRDMLAYGVSKVDFFMVGHFLGMAAAGIYNIVLEVAYLAKKVRQALEPILAPLVAEQHHLADRMRLKLTYGRATRWALVINLAYLGIAVLAGAVILNIYGDAFTAGKWALAILVMGQVINGAFGLSEMMLMMTGRPGLMFGNMAILLGLISLLNYVFIQIWGLTGAAAGTAAATVIVSLIQVIQVNRSAGVHPIRMALVKPVVACGVALTAAAFFPLWSMIGVMDQIMRAAIFLVFYFALLNVFGLEPEEKRFGYRILERFGLISPARADR